MNSNLRFAAIDIGSNAIRLLFSRIIENELKPHFLIKESLIRMPLRLGKDSFNAGEISEANCKKFLNTMIGFKNLMDAYNPMNYRACATAAMRNAKNGKDLARIVELKAGIKIDIINGAEEAAMILSKNINQHIKKEKSYLHIDVGGGSTELTSIVNGQTKNSKSFSIGSVRLLEGKVSKKSWNDMKEWIKSNTNSVTGIKAIGSGGNINKIASMLGKKKGEYVPYNGIKILLKKIEALNLILDATHLCDTSFWETMKNYNGPIWASHNNCRKFVNHNRQFSDEQIKELINRDAVIGVALDAWMMVPNWVRGESTPKSMGVTLRQMIDNIDHICQLSGDALHVGIGTDLDGGFGKEQTPSDLETIADLQKVPQMLADKGFDKEDIDNIMHQNFISFLRRVWG